MALIEVGDGKQPEFTLDPDSWDAFRALAHRMVDDMLTHVSTLRAQPAWREMPPDVRASFNEPVPEEGVGEDAAYASFVRNVMPYTNGNLHPRFWGWVQGNGTPLGMMADMLAAGLNPHMAGFNQAPALVEHEVIRWLVQLMGLPGESSGVLVTGGTMANTIGLTVARHAAALANGLDVKEDGLQSCRPGLVVYGSTETHNWARKAVELLGLGNRSFRRVAVDEQFRIKMDALTDAVREDRAAGLLPFAVVGNAATVNTGAIDDLAALSRFCQAERLWLHVDGAFGALAQLSPMLRPLVKGIELADSIGFDLHKWGSLPFDCACVLVRNPQLHRETFAAPATYIDGSDRGVIAGGLPFAERGLDLTRGFKALKVWLTLKAHGTSALTRVVEQNVRQVRHLVHLVTLHANLELVAPAPLNVACFRFVAPAVPEANLNAINREILLRLQERGLAVPSGTTVNGKYAIRVANVNHRSRTEDFTGLANHVIALGFEICREMALPLDDSSTTPAWR